MTFKIHLFYLLVTIICSQSLSAQNPIVKKQNHETAIDSVIRLTMAETGIIGMGAAIIVDKKIVWSNGYGYADKENEIPFTINTVMNIASTTKSFTGVCLMDAFEQDEVSLDDDINNYLPFRVSNPNFPKEKITLRNLATHTSSLADRDPFYGDTYQYGGGQVEELGMFLKNYFDPNGKYYSTDNFLKHKPGTYYQYSNIPVALAGYIVELATGKKLAEYGRKIIFKPLKMKNTTWAVSEINYKNHTKLYDRTGNTLKSIPLYTFPTYPEGGIRSSVADLSKYFATLLNYGIYEDTRILEKESVKEMQKFQFHEANKPVNINLDNLNSGIFWATKMGASRVGYNGSDPGVRVFMLSDLNKEIGVVFFINTTVSDQGVYFDIYDSLYKYGTTLKKRENNNK